VSFAEDFFMLFQQINHYKNLGYHFNPFHGLTGEEFEMAFPPGEDALQVVSGDFQVFQIVGCSGAGKTSLLKQIFNLLENRKEAPLYYYVRNSRDLPDFSPISFRWIIIDEAQRLHRDVLTQAAPVWKNIGVKIILGSHMDHETWFGKSLAIKTIYLSRILASRFAAIVEARLRFAAIEKPLHQFSRDAICAWAQASDYSLEKARAIGFEIFLNKALPDEIGSEIVEKAAISIMENTKVMINKSYTLSS
jgi:hypothetical protein